MGPQHKRDGVLKVLAGVAVLIAVAGAAAVIVWHRGDFREAGAVGSQVSPVISSRAEELRLRFPFESLADRLNYEGDGPTGEEVSLPEATAGRLNEAETQFDQWKTASPRMQSLARLHSDQVEEFINQPGFGYGRTFRMVSPSYLDLPPASAIPFAQLSALPSDGEGSRVELPETAAAPLLSLHALGEFHNLGSFNFLDPGNIGLVQDRGHVAGFRSHSFGSMPELRDPLNGAATSAEHWVVGRLELVSLLKYDRPAVYVSDHLPRMDDLKKSKTRPPSEFETRALKSLRAGDDLVVEATTNRLLLMGSLRAMKQCLDCHHARRGDLLGAFSYDLRRDPAGS